MLELAAGQRARRLGREPALDRRPLTRLPIGRHDCLDHDLGRDRADRPVRVIPENTREFSGFTRVFGHFLLADH